MAGSATTGHEARVVELAPALAASEVAVARLLPRHIERLHSVRVELAPRCRGRCASSFTDGG